MTNSGTPQKGDVWQLASGNQLRITKVAADYVRGQIRHGAKGRFTKKTVAIGLGPFRGCIKSAA